MLDWLPTAEQENHKNFWAIADNAKKPVIRQIQKIIRLRKGDKEHFFYHESLTSLNKHEAPIHHFHTVGKFEDPTFTPTWNHSTGEKIGTEIYSWDTVYELEWKKD